MALMPSGKSGWSVSEAYSVFLLSNLPRISNIENTLRNVTWLLPGRFRDAELASEGMYAGLNLLSTVHDQVILRAADALPDSQRPRLSPHGRYTQAWMAQSSLYRRIAKLLTLLSYTQLLMEMAAVKRYGRDSKKRWRLVIGIEAFKALLRLLLFHTTVERTIVHPPVPEREIDPATLNEKHAKKPALIGSPPHAQLIDVPLPVNGDAAPAVTCVDRLNHKRPSLDEVPKTDAALRVWLTSRALSFDDIRRPELLVRRTGPVGRFAEYLWIFRPLVYVLAMRQLGERHTAPWALSLVLDALSRQLRIAQMRIGTHIEPVSDAEKLEHLRRERALWWYLFRGPAWEQATKPRLEGLIKRWEKGTILGIAATLLRDYVPLLDTYHFYKN